MVLGGVFVPKRPNPCVVKKKDDHLSSAQKKGGRRLKKKKSKKRSTVGMGRNDCTQQARATRRTVKINKRVEGTALMTNGRRVPDTLYRNEGTLEKEREWRPSRGASLVKRPL